MLLALREWEPAAFSQMRRDSSEPRMEKH